MKRKGEAEKTDQKEVAKASVPRSRKGPGLLQRLGVSGGHEPQGSGVGKYAAVSIVASMVVGVMLAGAMAWLQFGEHQERSEERLATAVAQQQAGIIGLALQGGQRQADAIANSVTMARILEAGEADRERLIEELSGQIPDGRVYLLQADERVSRDDLSYTVRDLVQQARRGEVPAPVMMPGDPPVLLVARTTAGGEATIVVEQGQQQLYRQLRRVDLLGGQVEIIARDVNAIVLSRGKPARGPAATATIGNLAVTYTPRAREHDAELAALFLTVVVGALLLLLLVQAISFRSVASAMREDVSLLVQYAEDLRRPGATRSRGSFSFPPLAGLTSVLDKLVAAIGTGKMDQKHDSVDEIDSLKEMIVEGESSAAFPEDGEEGPSAVAPQPAPPEEIFREYDIRGVVGETLTAEGVEQIGRAIGSEVLDAGEQSVVVGRDGRESSPELAEALVLGVTASGCNVIDIGAVPTPLVYYATHVLNTRSGVCVTGSHNAREYNGLKVVVNGETLAGDRIRALRTRIEQQDLASGEGQSSSSDLGDHYRSAVVNDIVLARPMKIVIDCGNGIAGATAPQLFEQLECEVIPLYTNVDGSFPNHHPDPGQPENLKALIDTVSEQGADLGLAFDGDGDRLVVVTPSGEIIWPDRLMMCYARDLLSRSPGSDILFDVKCSRELAKLITRMGGRPLMWKSGHSLMKAKLKETGAPLAGEMSGHIYFADRWFGFDDGLYSAARLLEILSLESSNVDEVFARLVTGVSTPEMSIPVKEEKKFELVRQLAEKADEFDGGKATTLDGLRVDFRDGWGLVRASNTAPALTARFEGQDKGALARIQEQFRTQLQAIDPNLELPF